MAPSREALAPRASTTLDIVRQILGTLAARNHADEVLTCVRQIPAREATFRPLPEWVRPDCAKPIRRREFRSCTRIRPPQASLYTTARTLSWSRRRLRERPSATTFRC